MAKIKAAINGCGRIGRGFLKAALKKPEIEIVAVNDLAELENIVYLLNHDSIYGRSEFEAKVGNGERPSLTIAGREIAYLREPDPSLLPWVKFGVDVVLESTGRFSSYERAGVHLAAGAKRVVITAPAKADRRPAVAEGEAEKSGATVLLGINEEKFKGCSVTSNGSCTTNAASPLIAILDEAIGIEKAVLNTVHAYTASQGIVDGPNKKDFREGRAGAENIVPSSTGAATAVTAAFPKLSGLFDGISIRVPVAIGSIVDLTFIAKKNTTAEAVNSALEKAAGEKRWQGIFSVSREPLVSRDIVGNRHPSIADLSITRVVGGNLVKVLAWYDNEMGYVETLIGHVIGSASGNI